MSPCKEGKGKDFRLEGRPQQDHSCLQRTFHRFRVAIADPAFQTELATNAHLTVSDTLAVVSKPGPDVPSTQSVVPDVHSIVAVSQTQTRLANSTRNGSIVSFAPSTLCESPPPAPGACFGRGELIEKIVGLAENLKPIALVGAGGIGKTSIALTILHHDRIKQRFGGNRCFVHCDQSSPSCAHFLDQLSKVIGTGIENPKDLATLRPFLCSKDTIIVLDNLDAILDPQGMDVQEIYAVVKELGQLSNICVCITSRTSTIPSNCETVDIPALSIDAARDAFYHTYKNGERTNLIDNILDQLDRHPLSITLLAMVAHHKEWDANRLMKEWETRQTSVLHTEHNRSLAATTELSSVFQDLGPDTRALLGVVSYFPQGVVHVPANPHPDTQATFPRPLVTLPHIPHGFRALDIDKNANIRAKSTIKLLTKHWAESYITTWGDTTLHSGIDTVFALAPNNPDFLTGERMRNLLVDPTDPPAVRVNFERPFTTPPKVVVFLNYVDLDKNHNWRIITTAVDIDENGFMLNIDTWADTILYAAQACWIAYPAERKHIFSTAVNTMDVRPWYLPQLQQSGKIKFDTVEFWKDPSVFIALNSFDISIRANLRVDVHVDNVSKTGLVWHIDSWSDTVLYSAGASIIAFN